MNLPKAVILTIQEDNAHYREEAQAKPVRNLLRLAAKRADILTGYLEHLEEWAYMDKSIGNLAHLEDKALTAANELLRLLENLEVNERDFEDND